MSAEFSGRGVAEDVVADRVWRSSKKVQYEHQIRKSNLRLGDKGAG